VNAVVAAVLIVGDLSSAGNTIVQSSDNVEQHVKLLVYERLLHYDAFSST
jgi:hypothetical protein